MADELDPRDPHEIFRDLRAGTVPGLHGWVVDVAAFPGFVRLVVRDGGLEGWGNLLTQIDLDPFLAARLADILHDAVERAE